MTLDAPDSRTGLDVQVRRGPRCIFRLVLRQADVHGHGGARSYRILSGGKAVRQFAVNLLDPAESDIRPPADPAIKIGYVEIAGKKGLGGGPP